MFQIGLEFDFGHLTDVRNRRIVWAVALAGLAVPFALGFGFGLHVAPLLSPASDPVASALFVAVAFSITALPILGRILIDLGLSRTALGVIAIAAAAINDVVGWLLLAMVTAITVAAFSMTAFVVRIGLVAIFFGVVVRRAAAAAPPAEAPVECRGPLPHGLVGVILAVVFVGAMTTYQLGIFAIFGGFMMGVVLHQERAFVAAWNERIGAFVMVFFLPIFFTFTGLRTDIGGLSTVGDWAGASRWSRSRRPASSAVATSQRASPGCLARRAACSAS